MDKRENNETSSDVEVATEVREFTYVLIAGGRSFDDVTWMRKQVWEVRRAAERSGRNVRLLTGGARGADTLAADLGRAAGFEVGCMPARWDAEGRSAGFRRNERMAAYLVAKQAEGARVEVIVFPGGNGSAHMRQVARAKGLRVFSPVRQPATVAP